jgi:hypothetical protein
VQKIVDEDLRTIRNMPPKKGTKKGKAKPRKAVAAPEPPIELVSTGDELPTRITKGDEPDKTAQGREKGKAREVEVEKEADEVIELGSDNGEDEKERESSEEEVVVEVKRRTVVPGKPKRARSDYRAFSSGGSATAGGLVAYFGGVKYEIYSII